MLQGLPNSEPLLAFCPLFVSDTSRQKYPIDKFSSEYTLVNHFSFYVFFRFWFFPFFRLSRSGSKRFGAIFSLPRVMDTFSLCKGRRKLSGKSLSNRPLGKREIFHWIHFSAEENPTTSQLRKRSSKHHTLLTFQIPICSAVSIVENLISEKRKVIRRKFTPDRPDWRLTTMLNG